MLCYHNDGKEKSQSHEIYDTELENVNNVFCRGYGSNKKEALQDFAEKLIEVKEELAKLNKSADEYINAINKEEFANIETVAVDCLGKEINIRKIQETMINVLFR